MVLIQLSSDTAPSNPTDGDLWWNSDNGELKVYYNDGNSSQWVDANSEGGFVQYWTQTNTNGSLGITTTGFVGIGTTTATDALTVKGNVNVTGVSTFSGNVTLSNTLTANSQVGTAGSVLSSTGSGLQWVSPLTGPQGAQGHQGVQGATGAQGHQGVQGAQGRQGAEAVSYTHLTLPTTPYV